MQSNAPVGQHYEQQPALPSYAEAMRTAAQPTLSQSYTVDQDSFHPTAPTFGPQTVPIHTQYSGQPNYTQVPHPATGYPYSAAYATTAYPQYGQTATDLGGPTTIHVIRPVATEESSSTCCRGTSGRLLGIVLIVVVLGAILRLTISSFF